MRKIKLIYLMYINNINIILITQGKLFVAIESGNDTQFNNLCIIPQTGILFIANESTKIQTYYIPVCSSIYI